MRPIVVCICLSVCLSIRLSIRLSVCQSVCLSVGLSVNLSVYLSTCLLACLSACLPACTCVSLLFSKLLPSFLDQFWVLVENDFGKGNYSTVVTHQTEPSYPTGVVNNVQAEGISTTDIKVTWEPVDLVQKSSLYECMF